MPEYYNPLNVKLDSEKAKTNVIFIRNYLTAKGWSLNAICGILGNFHTELGGTFNPNVYQGWVLHSDELGRYGYGLAQWTPWLGRYYVNPNNGLDYSTPEGQRHYHGTNDPTFGRWCLDNGLDKSTMEAQLDYLNLGLGGYSTKYWSETVTWSEFIHSDKTPSELAKIFYKNYERSESNDWGARPDHADSWYTFFTGEDAPEVSEPSEDGTNPAISSAVAWAVQIANDDTHGYDQENRWGEDYDCSSLIIEAYERAGIPVKTNGATYTGDMVDVFCNTGFIKLLYSEYMVLRAGDVLWKDGHVAMMVSSTKLVEATINELGTTTGGEMGDQTGEEIVVRDHDPSRGWIWVLRIPSINVTPLKEKTFNLLFWAIATDRF